MKFGGRLEEKGRSSESIFDLQGGESGLREIVRYSEARLVSRHFVRQASEMADLARYPFLYSASKFRDRRQWIGPRRYRKWSASTLERARPPVMLRFKWSNPVCCQTPFEKGKKRKTIFMPTHRILFP